MPKITSESTTIFWETTCFQIMAKGRTQVAVSLLNPKGQLSEELAQELAADREESAADVLKQRGWKPMEGPCVALLAEIKENKVAEMEMSTFSGLKENVECSSPADSQGAAERGAGPGARGGRRGERDGRAEEEGMKFKMTPNVS